MNFLLRMVGTQNWLRWGFRYRLFHYLKPRTADFAVPFFGKVYYGNFNSFIDRCVFFYGAHEREAMLLMGSYIPAEGVVFDIGANVGHHSLYFSRKARQVHAFEPDPDLCASFEHLMKKNEVTNVLLHKVGAGAERGSLPFYRSAADNKGIGSFLAGKTGTVREAELQIIPLDDLDLDVDFIKIDTEGYERQVLQGLRKTILRCKPVIVLEYTKGLLSEEDFAGYVPYMIRVNRPFLYVFNKAKAVLMPFDANVSRAEILLVPKPVR